MSPRPCTICQHEKCEEIEEAIGAGVPYRRLARRYGVSIAAISRHLKAHVAPALMEMMRERIEELKRREVAEALGEDLAGWLEAESANIDALLREVYGEEERTQ